MTTSRVAVIAATAALAMSSCDAPSHHVSRAAPSPTKPAKHIVHGTGHLRMTITPTTGPVGTDVKITATGCSDPDGRNHAVSFNPGFGNTLQAAAAHYELAQIPARLTAQTLIATYRISADDARAASRAASQPPQFYVQCSDDLATATFRIKQ